MSRIVPGVALPMIRHCKEVSMIPQDPIILLSYINTQLRDNYSSLDVLSEGLDISQEEVKKITATLESVGYKYDSHKNQFV